MDPRLMPPMVDNRLGSLVRAPTMNLNREGTNLSRVDPLKQMFRSLFDLIHPSARGHVIAVIGEFLGTLIFVFLAFAGVEVAGASSNKVGFSTNTYCSPMPSPCPVFRGSNTKTGPRRGCLDSSTSCIALAATLCFSGRRI